MMETTLSRSKAKMGGSGKRLVSAMTLKTKERSTKYKMARYDIGNVSMKDLVNKITEFEKISKVPPFKKEPKHEPRKVVGNRSGSQDQSKVYKIQNGKV